MVATDYWSSQERCIVSGLEFGFILASGTIAEGDMLKFSHSATGAYGAKITGIGEGKVVMETASSGLGTAWAVAQKAAASGDTFPVMFIGIQKMLVCGSAGDANHKIFAGSFVINSAHATKIVSTKKAWVTADTPGNYWISGLSHILGTALQMANGADEILVLVGRSV